MPDLDHDHAAALAAMQLTDRQWVALRTAQDHALRRGKSGWCVGFRPGRASFGVLVVRNLAALGLITITDGVATATDRGRAMLQRGRPRRPDPSPRAAHAGSWRKLPPPVPPRAYKED